MGTWLEIHSYSNSKSLMFEGASERDRYWRCPFDFWIFLPGLSIKRKVERALRVCGGEGGRMDMAIRGLSHRNSGQVSALAMRGKCAEHLL